MPCPGLFEPFTESVVLGVLMSLSVGVVLGWNPLIFFACHCLLWLLFDIVLYSVIQVCCGQYNDSLFRVVVASFFFTDVYMMGVGFLLCEEGEGDGWVGGCVYET